MKASEQISEYQKWFPPMYREDEGIRYSFAVFLSRVRLLAMVCGAIALLFLVILFLGRNSELGLPLRIAIVVGAGYAGWQMLGVLRYLRQEAAERKNRTNRDVDLEDSKELAALVGGAWMVMAVAGIAGEEETSSADEPAIHRVIACLIHKSAGGKPVRVTMDGSFKDSIVYGCVDSAVHLQALIRMSKSRLILDPEKRAGVVSLSARGRLVETLRRDDIFIEFSRGERLRPSLIPIVKILGTGSIGPDVGKIDPATAVESVAAWLESIHVSVADDPKAWAWADVGSGPSNS